MTKLQIPSKEVRYKEDCILPTVLLVIILLLIIVFAIIIQNKNIGTLTI